ncbi:hypothetical protein GTV32_11115 [Gordonia sp. SID5947]|uniref:hypothetical protein n=1 Tax=Gordonia sp. SID5947 TaxID=2690315 RepID=UPI00136DDDD7|nr:hypothetical protein [Gordonia sp. SID5947]MYR06819.1 hypothetical protein [Gordonia sp. SID5947]
MNSTTTKTPHKSSSVRPPSARSTAKRIAGAAPSARREKTDEPTSDAPPTPRPDDEAVAVESTVPIEAAADGEAAPVGSEDESATGPRRRARLRAALTGRRTRRVFTVVIAVVAVAGVALAGWFGLEWKQARDVDNAATAAKSVAEQYAVSLTSVSADSVDKDFATVLGGATGGFKDMYAKSSAQLRQLLVDNKADAQGKVIASGIQSATTDKVVVLLFIDQTVRNASTPEPRIDRSRVVMTMDKVGDRWLASKVDLP